MARTAVMAMMAVLALLLAGCMGSSNSTADTTTGSTATTVPPPPVTHRQFVKRLDRLCRVYNDKLARMRKRYADVLDSNDYAAIARVWRREEKLVAPWGHAVGRLQVPPGDERRFRQYLLLVDRMDALSHREIRAILREDADEFSRLEGLIAQARNKRTNVAVDLGLRFCGS